MFHWPLYLWVLLADFCLSIQCKGEHDFQRWLTIRRIFTGFSCPHSKHAESTQKCIKLTLSHHRNLLPLRLSQHRNNFGVHWVNGEILNFLIYRQIETFFHRSLVSCSWHHKSLIDVKTWKHYLRLLLYAVAGLCTVLYNRPTIRLIGHRVNLFHCQAYTVTYPPQYTPQLYQHTKTQRAAEW
jgi:hypothetical protein